MEYGVININGKNYIERDQTIPFIQTISTNSQVVAPVQCSLPGAYDFLLKGLTRTVIASNVPVTNRPFLWKFGNTDGSIWYSQAGVGGTTDRVLDSLIFGPNAAFQYPIIPGVYYSKNGAITMEFQDISVNAPYTIYIAFHGSYLIPVGNQ